MHCAIKLKKAICLGSADFLTYYSRTKGAEGEVRHWCLVRQDFGQVSEVAWCLTNLLDETLLDHHKYGDSK